MLGFVLLWLESLRVEHAKGPTEILDANGVRAFRDYMILWFGNESLGPGISQQLAVGSLSLRTLKSIRCNWGGNKDIYPYLHETSSCLGA